MNCQNCKSTCSENWIQVDERVGNCSECGAFRTKEGIVSFKLPKFNMKPDFAPLEHYHTILLDENYQKYQFLTTQKQYYSERKKLIELLFSTGKKLRQTRSTVYLAIKYMDIILNTSNEISQIAFKSSFKVIAVVCLNIAAKFDSLDLNAPYPSELQRASGCGIPYDSMIHYEREICKILNWNLKLGTLYHTIEALTHQGIIFSDDTRDQGYSIEEDLQEILFKANNLLEYFMDYITKEAECSHFRSTHQAAACILAVRKLLNLDNPFSTTLSEMLMFTEDEIPPELLKSTNYVISLLELESPEKKDLQPVEAQSTLKSNLKARVKILEKIHDFHSRAFTQKRHCTSVHSSENSSKISNPEITLSSEEENAGLFYYEDSGLQIPYNLDDIELSYIENQIHRQMMSGQMPLGPIRSASVGSDGYGTYKDRISSLLGGNTKGSTSGKENLEDLNNDESPLITEEMYRLTEKLCFGSPSQIMKYSNSRFSKEKDLSKNDFVDFDSDPNTDAKPEIPIA
ncbi:unnamed protein product [Moneuplotes crassus]|uniref:GATA-type domain-containing protein n=1 Tax=Euplotes crassus TaxID=5936 RepID=A0AAD1XBW6_EUPCR|nr:unnamed protein product [Moneuplotes crassus]